MRYVRSETEKLRIVRCCHADPTSGHLGEKKTYNRIIERFTWKGVMKDVKQVVSDVYFLIISYTMTYCRYLHVMSVKE